MWGQLRTRGAVGLLCLLAVATVTAPRAHPFVVVLELGLLLAAGGSWAHEQVCARLLAAPFYVYRLLDAGGVTLYVGSTDEWKRRALEHTDGSGEPWRRHIHSIAVHRHCHSERQSLRIERRMIRALTVGSELAYCLPLRNDTWAQPNPNWAVRRWRWGWMHIYRGQSFLWHWCHWTYPPDRSGPILLIPQRPSSGDRWDEPNDDQYDVEDGPLTATYDPHARHAHRPDYTLLALPPVRDNVRDTTPLRSRGQSRPSVTPERDAQRDNQNGTETRTAPPAAGRTIIDVDSPPQDIPPPANETAEDRKKRLARERQQRRRQAQKKAAR